MSLDRAALLADLRRQVALLEDDVREHAAGPGGALTALQTEHAAAVAAGRTATSFVDWLDDEVAQAASSWVLATVFVRFCEDNGLVEEPWLAGPGERGVLASERQTAYFVAQPLLNDRDWLLAAFGHLASFPALAGVLDAHNPLRRLVVSADGAEALVAFWRRTDESGDLVHDLTDETHSTRFLGDLYQDLSEHAKKKYALLQTPDFVEAFILDRTLTPALAELGLEGLRLIDPTCGSGHFLLGAFERLLDAWHRQAPALDRRERVQRALDHVHGVDLNPFAVAIARFRLTVAAMRAASIPRLADAPAFRYNLAVGDSLLAGYAGMQGDLLADADGAAGFAYAAEDVGEHPGILERGRYHVVVGNPPYITVKDKALNEAYRRTYSTCHRQYALSVPFAELFFALAQRGDATTPAGYVGQITSNSFMKREFGSKLVEDLLSGADPLNPVDLTEVVDTSGAYIPGHGTPTAILVGRRRRPVLPTVRAVLGKRGEPGQPEDPAHGLVWTEIVERLDTPGFDGGYVTVTDLDRDVLKRHPWSLSGGGAGDLKAHLDAAGSRMLSNVWDVCGFGAITGEDEAFALPPGLARRLDRGARKYCRGEDVRDFSLAAELLVLWPYSGEVGAWVPQVDGPLSRHLWRMRTGLLQRRRFGVPIANIETVEWFEYREPYFARLDAPHLLAFAFVATHNHVVLDRGGKVFNRSAPVIKLPAGAGEDEHLDLLGVLNSSATCFWLKQVSQPKSGSGIGRGIQDEEWENRYEFTGTKLEDFPLPGVLPRERARRLDALARQGAACEPAAVLARGDVSREALAAAEAERQRVRAAMVFEQEELDWEVYRAYGLLDDDLIYAGDDVEGIALGERAFEVALARRVAEGTEETAWFERHGSTPVTELPTSWPAAYRDLVQSRLDVIASDPFVDLLERPEHKRRWAAEPWEKQEERALREWLLDRLEEPPLWRDGSGRPQVQSVAQLAGSVAGDETFLAGLALWSGRPDEPVETGLARLLADEHVPFLAALRHKPSGLRKRAEWERTWELQRAEDRGEDPGPIAVPPKYTSADFRRPSYWRHRGKLDVPKERFVSYPGAEREVDRSLVLGWAGWDHAEQGLALASLALDRARREGWVADRLSPLLAGLAEVEPWLHQWHADTDPAFGTSPAQALTATLEQQLAALGLTRTDLAAWRPDAPARGRRRAD